jgi:hypothetical protein
VLGLDIADDEWRIMSGSEGASSKLLLASTDVIFAEATGVESDAVTGEPLSGSAASWPQLYTV